MFLQVGECVNVKYTDKKTYGAFISYVKPNGKYRVYFIEDGEVMDDVDHKDISRPLTQGKTTIKCDKYAGRIFFEKGGFDETLGKTIERGDYVVKRVSTDNNFSCSRVGADPGEGEIMFDISYVIRSIRKYEEE